MKEIQYIKKNIDELTLDFGNPRKINLAEKNKLKKSLQEFGDFGVIVINEDDQVIAGNQRIQVMKEMEWNDPVDCKMLIGFSDEELKAINIRANKSAGVFDNEQLTVWLSDITKEIDIDLTGIEIHELKEITINEEITKNKEINMDDSELTMTITLKYNEIDYWNVKEKLDKINNNPGKAVKNILNV